MKKVILIANDAELTGKTLLANLCGSLLQRSGPELFCVIHTGSEEPSEDYNIHLDLSQGFDKEEILSIIEENAVTIIDLQSGYGEDFTNWLVDEDILDTFHDAGTELTVISPVGTPEDSYGSLVAIAETLNSHADYMVVHNDTLTTDRSGWDGSYAKKAMTFLDAAELTLTDLGEDLDSAEAADLLSIWEESVDLTELASRFEGDHTSSVYSWKPVAKVA